MNKEQFTPDKLSICAAFTYVSETELKRIAQRCREHIDWYGSYARNAQYLIMMECALEVIRKVHDPKFATEFIPAI